MDNYLALGGVILALLFWGIAAPILSNPVGCISWLVRSRVEADHKRDEVQAELERKCAIADAAIAARARGESFTPPADYDR